MSDNLIKVAQVSQLKPGDMMKVRVGDVDVLLANVKGEFYAIDDICTHEDASLSMGSLHGEFVKCPLHNSRFSVRTGAVLEEPADEDVATYKVVIKGDDVLVSVG